MPSGRSRAMARMTGSVMRWSPPALSGTAPASCNSVKKRSMRPMVSIRSIGLTLASPQSATRQSS